MDVEHQGSCHCEAIRWKFRAPQNLNGIQCNCSICHKKQNHHVIIKKDRFELLTGADNLTTYTFNTGAAKHQFCKTCGIQSFYFPRSNPDDIGFRTRRCFVWTGHSNRSTTSHGMGQSTIMPHCVNGNTIKSITWTYFDGQNWEKHMINNAPTAL